MKTPTLESFFEVGGIRFKITSIEDKTVEVAHKNYIGNVIIPSAVDYNGTTYSVTKIGEKAFTECSGLNSILIPNSITEIREKAFQGCYGLESIVIPNSVTTIGSWAFSRCSGLNSIISHIPADKLFPIEWTEFEGIDKSNCTLSVPKGAKEVYAKTDGWSNFENIVELKE